MTKVEDMAAAKDLSHLIGVLPHLEYEINRMNVALDNRIFTLLEHSELTPELALQAWMEKNANRKLLSRFNQRIQIGQSSGERVKNILNG